MKIKQIVSGMFAGVVLVSSLSLGAPAKAGEFCLDIWNDDCDLVPDSDLLSRIKLQMRSMMRSIMYKLKQTLLCVIAAVISSMWKCITKITVM